MAIKLNKAATASTLQNIAKTGVEESNKMLVKDIPLDQIQFNPDNEKIFSMRDIEGLMHSIESVGFMGTIEVYKIGKDKYQISAGHRRYEAMRRLGRATIPCTISNLDNDVVVKKKLVESNINTRVLTPLELAKAITYYERILREENYKGLINEKLGEIFSISPNKVANLKSITKLIEELQNYTDSQEFPQSALEELYKASSFTLEQQKKLKDYLDQYKEQYPTGEITTNLISGYIERIKDTAKKERIEKQKQELLEDIQTEASNMEAAIETMPTASDFGNHASDMFDSTGKTEENSHISNESDFPMSAINTEMTAAISNGGTAEEKEVQELERVKNALSNLKIAINSISLTDKTKQIIASELKSLMKYVD